MKEAKNTTTARPIEGATPVHLDFTTLLGAARAVEWERLGEGRLPLSRVLALSQLVEAIVLHDRLQFENGQDSDWKKHYYLFKGSYLFRAIEGEDFLDDCDLTDADEASVVNAMRWAVDAAKRLRVLPLRYAAHFRLDTYVGESDVDDPKNETALRHARVVRDSGDEVLVESFNRAKARMRRLGVGYSALHALFRVRLLEEKLVSNGSASYFPHFSRQPLVKFANDDLFEPKSWSVFQLRAERERLLGKVKMGARKQRTKDRLALALSPILLACLADAKRPEDIIQRALKLRTSKAAKAFREECRLAYILSHSAKAVSYGFKLGLQKRIEGIEEMLVEETADLMRPLARKLGDFCEVNIGASLPLDGSHPPNVTAGVKFKGQKSRDETATFLKNIVSDAMGIEAAREVIQEVFGVRLVADAKVVGWIVRERMR